MELFDHYFAIDLFYLDNRSTHTSDIFVSDLLLTSESIGWLSCSQPFVCVCEMCEFENLEEYKKQIFQEIFAVNIFSFNWFELSATEVSFDWICSIKARNNCKHVPISQINTWLSYIEYYSAFKSKEKK